MSETSRSDSFVFCVWICEVVLPWCRTVGARWMPKRSRTSNLHSDLLNTAVPGIWGINTMTIQYTTLVKVSYHQHNVYFRLQLVYQNICIFFKMFRFEWTLLWIFSVGKTFTDIFNNTKAHSWSKTEAITSWTFASRTQELNLTLKSRLNRLDVHKQSAAPVDKRWWWWWWWSFFFLCLPFRRGLGSFSPRAV